MKTVSRYETEDEDRRERDAFGGSAPTYEEAPATLEMRPSPFHPIRSATPTTPGMPSPVVVDPVITQKPFAPPRIVGTPELDSSGPTPPDAHPRFDAATHDSTHDAWVDAGPTDVSGLPQALRPVVPPPDAPKIEISRSLLLESEDAKPAVHRSRQRTNPGKRSARRRHHVPQEGPGPAAPTYVMLPALRRKKVDDEGSDWPLIAGLVLLAVLIAGLIGVGAYFAVRTAMSESAVQTEP